MKWSLRIAKLAGINVYVHWTFIVLLVWIGIGSLIDGGRHAAVRDLGLMMMIFSFIVLHELGHALTARRFGIRTRDITLLPIGGVARLERMPEDPREELLVAIAGPAVNFVIATLVAMITVFSSGWDELTRIELIGTDILITAFYINIGMGTFNLLPAFPMDGGRMLRALLVRRMGYVAATETAATVGQILAIMLGILGFFTHGMLIFVAVFVYVGAQQEAFQVQLKSILKGVPVREAMRTHFMSFFRDDEVTAAAKELLAGNQHDFPVVDENHELSGMLYHAEILRNLEEESEPVLIDKVMQPDCGFVAVNAMLDDALNLMNARSCSVLPVVQSGQVVGLISLENIGAFMMIQSARKHRRTIPSIASLLNPSVHPSAVHAREKAHADSTPLL